MIPKCSCSFSTSTPAGAAAASRRTTSSVLAALGTRKTSSSLRRYTMRSSTTPPLSLQHIVYCALPGPMRPRSLVRQVLTYAVASGPRTVALPRWDTSKTPTALRTAVCSRTTPAPGYSIGISQPPKSAIFAPRATWRPCIGDLLSGASVMIRTVSPLSGATLRSHHAPLSCTDPLPWRCPAHPYWRHQPDVTDLSLTERAAAELSVDALIVGSVAGPEGVVLAAGHGLPRAAAARVVDGLHALHAKGAADEVLTLTAVPNIAAPLVIVTGLGPGTSRSTAFDPTVLRRAAGAAVRAAESC